MKWSDEEMDALAVMRETMSLKEIANVLANLTGIRRSTNSIQKAADRADLPQYDGPGVPNCGKNEKLKELVDSEIAGRKEVPVGPLPDNLAVSSLNVDADGRVRSTWYKAKAESGQREAALRRAIKEIPSLISPKPKGKSPSLKNANENILSVYPIGDPHIGMLSWARETGEDYDLEIARRRHEVAMWHLVERADPTKNALIINLGDFYHADSNEAVTSRSRNHLDVDSRWHKMIETGVSIFVNMIEAALTRHENVHIITEIGNHDDHSAIFLSIALRIYYRNDPRVSVDDSPAKFHYYEFGKNFIGVTHGDTVKPQEMESIMSCDRPEEWGRSKYRYWYMGHIHHSRKWEFRGCVVESFRTLAGKDAWHSAAGYRSQSDMTKILLHREFGEVGRYTIDTRLLAAMEGADG